MSLNYLDLSFTFNRLYLQSQTRANVELTVRCIHSIDMPTSGNVHPLKGTYGVAFRNVELQVIYTDAMDAERYTQILHNPFVTLALPLICPRKMTQPPLPTAYSELVKVLCAPLPTA